MRQRGDWPLRTCLTESSIASKLGSINGWLTDVDDDLLHAIQGLYNIVVVVVAFIIIDVIVVVVGNDCCDTVTVSVVWRTECVVMDRSVTPVWLIHLPCLQQQQQHHDCSRCAFTHYNSLAHANPSNVWAHIASSASNKHEQLQSCWHGHLRVAGIDAFYAHIFLISSMYTLSTK